MKTKDTVITCLIWAVLLSPIAVSLAIVFRANYIKAYNSGVSDTAHALKIVTADFNYSINDPSDPNDYAIAWQSKFTDANGIGSYMWTYSNAKTVSHDANKKYGTYINHYPEKKPNAKEANKNHAKN